MSLKRLVIGLVSRPILILNRFISNPSDSPPSLNHSRIQNFYFKSKLLILIGLIFLATNILFSNLFIFSIDNYNKFIDNSKKLDLYLDLNRKFFKSNEFLYNFKSFDTNFNYYNSYLQKILNYNKKSNNVNRHTQDIYNGLFNSNYSSTAYLNYLIRTYTTQQDPENYLKTHKTPFHWGDWIDLSPSLPFAKSYNSILKSSAFKNDELKLQSMIYKICYNELFDERKTWVDNQNYNENVQVFEELQDISICSSIFLSYYWPVPERLLFESDYNYFSIPIDQGKRLKKPLGLNGLMHIFSGTVSSSVALNEFIESPQNREDKMDELLRLYEWRTGSSIKEISLQEQVYQDPSDFERPDFDEIFSNYSKIKKPTYEEKKYLNFLNYSKNNVKNAQKFYFTFPLIRADKSAELHHYTFPWIRQIISHEERIKVVHHLIRSWFKFCEKAGVISWFHYGNSIGWYFNAMNLPWDNDVDIQLSIKDMDFLGRNYNNSLVIEDPKLGDGLFWFQTNPFYLQDNDKQFIDARYIDAKTGIYIDISALWHDGAKPPDKLKLNSTEIGIRCKHNNWFGYNEIFPIKRTIYEGAQAYMINNITQGLLNYYGKHPLEQKNEHDHNWQPDIGLWVPNPVCEGKKIPPTAKRFDENGELTFFGACNDTELLELYNKARPAWELHKKEVELIGLGKSTAELTKKSLPIFRYFSHDDYR